MCNFVPRLKRPIMKASVETFSPFNTFLKRLNISIYTLGERPANVRNSAKFLERDDILKISYSVRRAGYPANTTEPCPGGPGVGDFYTG